MALLKTGSSNSDELSLLVELVDISTACVTHTGTDTTDELIDCVGERSLKWNTTLNAFRNELLVSCRSVALEVSVAGALVHSTEGTHATVNLELSALIELELTWGLLTACNHGAEHYNVSTCCESLNDIAGELNTTVSDDRDAILGGLVSCIEYSCDLWNTDTCNDTCCADGARADTDLYAVCAGIDKSLGSLSCSNVTADNLKVRESSLDLGNSIDNAAVVAVSGVESNNVNTCLDEGSCTLENVSCSADSSTAEESAAGITGGVRILNSLLDILDSDKAAEHIIIINDRELLDSVLTEDLLSVCKGCTYRSCNEIALSHNIYDWLIEISRSHESKVSVCEDADKFAVLADRNTGNLVLTHELVSLPDGVCRSQEEWIYDDTVFGTLYAVDHVSLHCDWHILVNDTDTAFTGNGNSHVCLCNSIHSGCHNWCVELDLLCKVCGEVYLRWEDVGLCRNKQNVVKGKAFLYKFLFKGAVDHGGFLTFNFSFVKFDFYLTDYNTIRESLQPKISRNLRDFGVILWTLIGQFSYMEDKGKVMS